MSQAREGQEDARSSWGALCAPSQHVADKAGGEEGLAGGAQRWLEGRVRARPCHLRVLSWDLQQERQGVGVEGLVQGHQRTVDAALEEIVGVFFEADRQDPANHAIVAPNQHICRQVQARLQAPQEVLSRVCPATWDRDAPAGPKPPAPDTRREPQGPGARPGGRMEGFCRARALLSWPVACPVETVLLKLTLTRPGGKELNTHTKFLGNKKRQGPRLQKPKGHKNPNTH